MNKKGQSEGIVLFFGIIFVVLLIVVAMWAFPKYKVYSYEMSGKADLREAEWNKQIEIEEAKAELESAELKKQADIIRAEGIAEANEIIAQSLTDKYITWKWVEGLHDGSSEIIYVPTEANLPILEAGR
jgi:predicted Holliday junction resolvase-like endonuclease